MDRSILLHDFLIVEISVHCSVKILKNLRLVCRGFNALITRYQHSICSRVGQACINSQELGLFNLYRGQALDLQALFLLDRRTPDLTFLSKFLFQNSQYSGIVSSPVITEDECNAIQSRMRNGFAILWTFADIAKDVQSKECGLQGRAMHLSQNVNNDTTTSSHSPYIKRITRFWGRLAAKLSSKQRKDVRSEGSILHQRVTHLPQNVENNMTVSSQPAYIKQIFYSWGQFVAKLSLQQRKDYALMRDNLSEAFNDRCFGPADADWFRLGSRSDYGDGDCWLTWFVLSTGPRFLCSAWKSADKNKALSLQVYNTWTSLSHVERLWQYRAGRETEASLQGYGDTEASGREELDQLEAELRLGRSKFDWDGHNPQPTFFLGTQMSREHTRFWHEATELMSVEPPLLTAIEPTRRQIAKRDEVRPWRAQEPDDQDAQRQKWLDVIPRELTYTAGRPTGPGYETPDGMLVVRRITNRPITQVERISVYL